MDQHLNEIKVYSDKVKTEGTVISDSYATVLEFISNGRMIRIGLDRSLSEEKYREIGAALIEQYAEDEKIRKTSDIPLLHHWYLSKDSEKIFVKGVVTGHSKFQDTWMVRIPVLNIETNGQNDALLIRTEAGAFCCPFVSCRFWKQDKAPELVPNYDQFKSQYQNKQKGPEIDEGKALLVLSDSDEYYFHSFYCVAKLGAKRVAYIGYPNTGIYQDSYLIQTDEYAENADTEADLDIRYYPHNRSIEFYTIDTCGCPLYAENIGSSVLRLVLGRKSIIRLNPGDRKLVAKESCEAVPSIIAGGDLYPPM